MNVDFWSGGDTNKTRLDENKWKFELCPYVCTKFGLLLLSAYSQMEKESRKKDNSRERKGKGKGEKNEKWKRVRLADVERKKME